MKNIEKLIKKVLLIGLFLGIGVGNVWGASNGLTIALDSPNQYYTVTAGENVKFEITGTSDSYWSWGVKKGYILRSNIWGGGINDPDDYCTVLCHSHSASVTHSFSSSDIGKTITITAQVEHDNYEYVRKYWYITVISPPKAKLKVYDLDANDNTVYPGENVDFTVKVKNHGSVSTSGDVKVTFYKDGSSFSTDNLYGINAGKTDPDISSDIKL